MVSLKISCHLTLRVKCFLVQFVFSCVSFLLIELLYIFFIKICYLHEYYSSEEWMFNSLWIYVPIDGAIYSLPVFLLFSRWIHNVCSDSFWVRWMLKLFDERGFCYKLFLNCEMLHVDICTATAINFLVLSCSNYWI